MMRRAGDALKKPPPSTRKVRREQGQGKKMRLVLTLLHQRNGNRRQKKLMWELKKTEMYSSCMMSRARCNEDNRKWQSSKWCAASFWADRSSGCICQGQLKGHCSSQDTWHQAETTNLGLQSSRKHVLKGSSEGVQQGLDIAGGTVSSSPKLCLVTSRLLQ